jgi:hypothetical protein
MKILLFQKVNLIVLIFILVSKIEACDAGTGPSPFGCLGCLIPYCKYCYGSWASCQACQTGLGINPFGFCDHCLDQNCK